MSICTSSAISSGKGNHYLFHPQEFPILFAPKPQKVINRVFHTSCLNSGSPPIKIHPENYPDSKKFTQKIHPEGGEKSTQKKIGKTAQIIIDAMIADPSVTRKGLADLIGKSEDTIKYHLAALQARKIILHIGPDNGGHWKVLIMK